MLSKSIVNSAFWLLFLNTQSSVWNKILISAIPGWLRASIVTLVHWQCSAWEWLQTITLLPLPTNTVTYLLDKFNISVQIGLCTSIYSFLWPWVTNLYIFTPPASNQEKYCTFITKGKKIFISTRSLCVLVKGWTLLFILISCNSLNPLPQ